MLSCLLLWPRHSSRQLLCPAASFVQSFSITLHYVPFACRPLLVTFGLWAITHAAQITTISTRCQIARSFHYITFHCVLIPSAGCSPPAALVVLACAVVRAAGPPLVRFIFPIFFVYRSQLYPPKLQRRRALVRCSRSRKPDSTFRGFPHSSHRPPSCGLLCSHPTSCSRSHSGGLRSP